MSRVAFMMICTLGLVAVLAIPAAAQEAPPSEDAQWYAGLGKNRQEELKKRYRALKRLSKDKQQAILKAGKEGKPILSDDQRASLQKLRKLSHLQRVRLYTLAAELHAVRNFRPAEFKKAMESEDRAVALRDLLAEQRAMLYMRSLPDSERRELMALAPEARRKALRAKYEEESKTRLTELEANYPRIAELRVAAETDKEARKQLKQMKADLKTLDLLLQRLEPERRKQVMSELRDLSMDAAANEIRKALKDQWQQETKRNKEQREKDRREGRPLPERNGARPNENRRKLRD